MEPVASKQLCRIYLLMILTPSLIAQSNALPQKHLHDITQRPLTVPSKSSHSLQVTNHDDMVYTVSISIGNPPQTFTAAIDVGWSDMFVPSVECSESKYCAGHPLFNSSSSKTFRGSSRLVNVFHDFFYTSGNVSSDTLHVGDIQITEQTFEEATSIRPVYFFDDTSYDVPLGLSREPVHTKDSNLVARSPFQNMVEQELLTYNSFALKLPQSEDDPGTLTIGVGDDIFIQQGAAVLPITQYTKDDDLREPYPSGGWQVEAAWLSADNGEKSRHDLDGYAAIFSTVFPFLDLPESFAGTFVKSVGVDEEGYIDCEKANSTTLPDLEISLKGKQDEIHTFQFTSADYIVRKPRMPFVDPRKCYVPIIGHEDSEDPKYNFVTLGSLFLRKYYSVFDADALTVTLSELADN